MAGPSLWELRKGGKTSCEEDSQRPTLPLLQIQQLREATWGRFRDIFKIWENTNYTKLWPIFKVLTSGAMRRKKTPNLWLYTWHRASKQTGLRCAGASEGTWQHAERVWKNAIPQPFSVLQSACSTFVLQFLCWPTDIQILWWNCRMWTCLEMDMKTNTISNESWPREKGCTASISATKLASSKRK